MLGIHESVAAARTCSEPTEAEWTVLYADKRAINDLASWT